MDFSIWGGGGESRNQGTLRGGVRGYRGMTVCALIYMILLKEHSLFVTIGM